MEFHFPQNIEGSESKTVKANDLATVHGSGEVDVLATPAMIAFMENTAYRSIQEFLPKDHTTVGYKLNIRHLKPTMEGAKIDCFSVLKKIEGNKLHFSLVVKEGHHTVGDGSHTRVVVRRADFQT